jgi:hypothetical protein
MKILKDIVRSSFDMTWNGDVVKKLEVSCAIIVGYPEG